MLYILMHLMFWVCLEFAFSSYFLSGHFILAQLCICFFQLLVPVAINGPTSSDAFRMGPSLWILFAALVQLQPSTHRLVLNGVLSSLAFGLRWWRAFNVLNSPHARWMRSIGRTKWLVVVDVTISFHRSVFVLWMFVCATLLSFAVLSCQLLKLLLVFQ